MSEHDKTGSDRDRFAGRVLGWFLVVLSLPVIGGTVLSVERVDQLLSVGAGVLLLLVGVLFLWLARRRG